MGHNCIAAHQQQDLPSKERRFCMEPGVSPVQSALSAGCGMTKEELEKAKTPFYTTRTTRKVGLGLPMIQMLAEQTEGSMELQSIKNEGTTLVI
ncbi:MAG: hypothetical protein CVV52_07980, partial [Spirochaetae bacterium HGW-Spirochaetae-8]